VLPNGLCYDELQRHAAAEFDARCEYVFCELCECSVPSQQCLMFQSIVVSYLILLVRSTEWLNHANARYDHVNIFVKLQRLLFMCSPCNYSIYGVSPLPYYRIDLTSSLIYQSQNNVRDTENNNFLFCFYEWETWSLTQRKEHRQRICKHAPLNTNNEIQDNAKESYYIHNKTHITLNVHTIRTLF
jgi:hypothetical protein